MKNIKSQTIKIDGTEYSVVDAYENFRAEDSFIHRTNKLSQFSGNGEAKKHVGTYAGDQGIKLSHFFDYNKWGIQYKDPEQNKKTMNEAMKVGAVVQHNSCFFSKSNLLQYLEDAKLEYVNQEQSYHNDIKSFYTNRLEEIKSLSADYIWFSIYDASDNHSERQNRAYIRSDDTIWNVWRKLILPRISYLSILKLQLLTNNSNNKNKHFFYFRILLDYNYRSCIHPSLVRKFTPQNNSNIQLKRSYRLGAEKYRKEVLEHMGRCPFTLISDERLLIASHIKPYIVCMNEGNETQANDYLNGLSLSPTYDKLFDQGYITFTDNGELICSTLLSPMTWSRLSINPGQKKPIAILPKDREIYLDYHRRNIFQGEINELI